MAIADLKEATPETSPEEIQEYAEQVVNEVAKDRAGEVEAKGDAQIVSETAAPAKESTKTIADDNSGRSVKADSQGEESGQASDHPKWLTDEVIDEASARGIQESELSDFTSRDELDRALRLLDKSALDVGRKAMSGSEESPSRNEKGQFVKKEQSESENTEEETPKEGRYEVSLDEELYDEEIIGEFSRMRDHYESRLEALESYFLEANAKAEEQQFDNLIDSLGHAELFGKTGSESKEELERRQELHLAVKAQMLGLETLGRPVEMSDQLIGRVANMVFGDELSKKQIKQKTSKISRQSRLRQGGSSTKPLPPRDDPRDEADRLYRELEQS